MHQHDAPASDKTQSGITVTLALSMLLASLGTSIANIALPALAKAFAAPFPQVQAVTVAYLATLTISAVIAGRLGDSHGLKAMLLAGLGVFLMASLLCAAAPGLWWLIAARAIQGVGAAFLMTLPMALMRQTAEGARLGRSMGLLGTMSALGTAIGPSLGGLVIPALGWRGIFGIQIPLAAVALLLAYATVPADPRSGKTPATSLWAAIDKEIVPNLFVNLLVAAVMMTTLVVGPFYLGFGLGLGEATMGIVMAIGPLISIFGGVPSGRMVDAWGADRVLAVGLAFLSVGAFLLAFLPSITGVAGYVFSIMVLTPGYQLFQAANNTAALKNASMDRRGMVSGLLGLSRNVGLVAGASVMSGVFAFGVGTKDFAHVAPIAIANGMRLTFLLAGGMMLVANVTAFGQRVFRSR